MKVLICLPFEETAPKGNSIAAQRLAQGFRAAGDTVSVLGFPHVDQETLVLSRVAEFQPEVVLVMHAWRCRIAFHAIRRLADAPMVVSLRGTDANEMLDDPDTGSDVVRILNESDGIVVFHEKVQKRLVTREKAWARKIRIIPNGACLPVSGIDYRSRLKISSNAFVFVSVGGVRRVKGMVESIPWLRDLRNEFPHLAWLHAGPILEPAEGERLKGFLAREPWMYHIDAVPHDEIDSFLRAGQVFVGTSRSEGMPHSVREAMLTGLPLLLSEIEGHLQMATAEGEALFFSDEKSFFERARRLLTDPELRENLGKNAKLRATRDPDSIQEIPAYRNLFLDIVQKLR